jgi:hypothetical protein
MQACLGVDDEFAIGYMCRRRLTLIPYKKNVMGGRQWLSEEVTDLFILSIHGV